MSRRAARTATAVLALAALLAPVACGSPPEGTWNRREPAAPVATPSAGTEVPVAPLAWSDCKRAMEELAGAQLSGSTADCATLKVPQDWSDTTGSTFDLALVRMRSTTQRERLGSLLVNPGGPGASGRELAALAPLFLPTSIRSRFDIVGFDPRGVGASTPVDCIPDPVKDAVNGADPDPVDQADFDRQVTVARGVGTACGRRYGAALGRFNTEQTARDMDAIRQAVGDPKLTYLGYSYGTLLGAVYAKLFPDRIRALVLDGAVDPQEDTVTGSEGQAAGFEQAFDAFAAACRAKGSGCPIGPDARGTVTRLLAQVRARPVPGRGGERRSATAGWVLSTVVAALYTRSSWTPLERALGDTVDGDPTRLFALVDRFVERERDGTYDNDTDAFLAVTCADEADPPTVAEVRALQASWRPKYPLFGAPLAMTLLGCAVWPGGHDPYPTGAAVGAPPILVVGTTGDPATPYENTAKLARQLGTGVVLTWEGEGHTAYPQTACVRDAVDDYLVALVVPEDGTTCR
jgi:pimeloyl-ACP methyl ester carboxylesterase